MAIMVDWRVKAGLAPCGGATIIGFIKAYNKSGLAQVYIRYDHYDDSYKLGINSGSNTNVEFTWIEGFASLDEVLQAGHAKALLMGLEFCPDEQYDARYKVRGKTE